LEILQLLTPFDLTTQSSFTDTYFMIIVMYCIRCFVTGSLHDSCKPLRTFMPILDVKWEADCCCIYLHTFCLSVC